ncbi:MAG TPA: hypothetical protein PKK85_04920 [Methanobacteriaceae archaeon]|nr:hypothetical protein [Methanobacteriaceae archaeon]
MDALFFTSNPDLIGKIIFTSYNKIMVMKKRSIGWFLISILILITGLATVNTLELSANTTSNEVPQIKLPEVVKILGVDDRGYVVRRGPYGNPNATITIAYILGVHPLEYESHRAIRTAVMERKNSLSYKYYVYDVNVLRDRYDYDLGRTYGQELARDYVVPDIVNQEFELVIDVHSNRGNYSEKVFITSLVSDKDSDNASLQIVSKLPWLKRYRPPAEPGPTSGPYVSIPLIRSGTPTLVYETYRYDQYDLVLWQAFNLVDAVDEIRWDFK